MKKKTILMFAGVIGLATVMTGCSYAGPFVTDIEYDGHGNLILKKKKVYFRQLTGPFVIGRISTVRDETTSIVRLGPKEYEGIVTSPANDKKQKESEKPHPESKSKKQESNSK